MKLKSVCALAAMVSFGSAFAANTWYVDADYRIVVPDRADDSSVWRSLNTAAESLQRAIRESVGLELKVVASSSATGKGFYLGDAFARREGLSADGLRGWGNCYQVKDGSVYLYGARDYTGRKDTRDLGWGYCVLPSVRSTVRFMEDVMDVRFVMPGWIGTDIPTRKALELTEGLRSAESPRIEYGVGAGIRDMMTSIANENPGRGDHRDFIYHDVFKFKTYAKTHPEYFGIVKGKRYCEHAWAENNYTPICITNPEVEELLVKAICERLDAGAEVCELCQSDGTYYCECENCLNYAGLRDNPGNRHSEQIWHFFRHIAERIGKERPGKIMKLMSYAAISRPPRDFHTFPSNVMIELCDYSDENLKRWKDWGTVPHGFTIYTYLWGTYYREGCTPKHSLDYIAAMARKFAKYDARGLWRCGGGELWGLEGPCYYVFNRLMRTPEAKVGDVFTDYLNRMYGPAAKPMRVFFETLDGRLAIRDAENEKVMDMEGSGDMIAKTAKKNNVESIAATWDETTMRRMEKALAAAQATENLTDKQIRRLKLVAFEFTYLKTIAAVCRNYLAFRAAPSEGTVKPTVESVRRFQRLIDGIYEGRDRPKDIPGWGEIPVLGGWSPRKILERNGRSAGRIEEPLSWDLEKILSDYDISGWQKRDGKNPKLRRLTDWRMDKGFAAERFEATGNGFHVVMAGTNPCVRVVSGYKGLLDVKPGRKCRLSWYVKLRDLRSVPTSRYGGERSMRVWYGAKWADCEEVKILSYKLADTDWVRQSVEFTPTGDERQMKDVVVRISEQTGEAWFRDVTVEELE